MFSWMFDYPTWVVGLIFALGATAISLGGMFLVRPLFHRWIHGNDKTNEMVSLNIASFSVFYGILLGLVAVGVYANYASAEDIVEREASTLAALYSDTSAMPEPHRAVLMADLRDYAKETIEKDWPSQARNIVPTGGTDRVNKYLTDLTAVHPTVKPDEIAYAEAFGQYEKLVELRSNRLAKVDSGIPDLLWWVLGIGAAFTIGIIWMLDMEIHVHGILTAVLSMFLGIVIFLIADMNKPFRGDVLVGSESYELVYNSLMKAR
ncbi:DUF4239 domain-containing protein [Phenylobacterium sp.]|jgi:hypothetical protein|uniref:bestrophin-like domain n=1 Tax=Phenylobacterium sp. TaxID=1871053 RepID=UPI002F3E2C7C